MLEQFNIPTPAQLIRGETRSVRQEEPILGEDLVIDGREGVPLMDFNDLDKQWYTGMKYMLGARMDENGELQGGHRDDKRGELHQRR